MNKKTVMLERALDKDGRPGSFGFSVLGGHGTKYPAVVCDIESGGPAHLSRMVQVGDRLLSLNGEELMELTSKDLVQRIRTAPSPSTFVIGEDEALRQQVLALLRKQERRAAAKRALAQAQGEGGGGGGGGETGEHISHGKKPSISSIPGEERRKKREKIIEVEPSVNIESGQNTDIVQVLDNKIIGRRVDQPVLSPDHIHSRGSRENSPLKNVSHSGRHHSPSPSTESGTGSPRRQRQRKTLEQQTAIGPPQVSGSSQSGLDSVSLQSASSGGSGRDNVEEKGLRNDGSVVTKELNGEVRSMPVSHSYTETLNDEGLPVAVVSSVSCEFPSMEGAGDSISPGGKGGDSSGDQDSGISLQIPSWKGPPLTGHKPRSSLAEEILVTELQHQSMEDRRINRDTTPPKPSPLLKEATPPPPENLPAIPESPKTPQSDSSRRHRVTPSRSSSKRKSNPYSEAVSLARHLYMLDGYKKSEVAEKLADPSDFGKMVVKEYLRFFEFDKLGLVESLRQFLSYFSLTGESQERERIMVHFSDRYFECNPGVFASVDTVHGMTVALLLLNTDLHSDHGGQKMSFSQFVNNLQGIGVQLPRDVLRKNYESIRKIPLEWASDDVAEEPSSSSAANHTAMATASGSSNDSSEETERTYHVTIPGTFVEVEMPGSAPLYKEGFVLRKNIMEGPHKKVSRGKRNWKQYYAYLKGFLLYFGQPQGELHLEDTSSAISVCHCLAMGASDYHKKSSVFRVTTSDWQSFLLQASSIMDMQQWIGAINKAAARYSSPPLAAPISSSLAFQRPTFPLAPTKNTLEQQIEHHEAKMKALDAESKEHQAYKPKGSKVKHSQLQSWFDKYEFLQYEGNRFRIYYASLTSDIIIDYNAPLPSGLVPSPSISTLATSSTDQDPELLRGLTPPHSPTTTRHKFHGAKSKNTGSPLITVASAHKS